MIASPYRIRNDGATQFDAGTIVSHSRPLRIYPMRSMSYGMKSTSKDYGPTQDSTRGIGK